MSDSSPPPRPPPPALPPPPSASSSSSSSSLDLLNPRPWASRKRAWASDTAKHVESIARHAITAASNRDWHHAVLQKHIDHDYYHSELDHADGVPLTKWNDYVAHHERLATANPAYRFDVLDAVADVYEKQGTAECFLLLRVTGHPVNVVRESIIVMYWRRKDDCWRCYGQRVVRGMFWNA